jgi:hypothetical protein
MSITPEAAKCGANQMKKGSAGACADSSKTSGGRGEAAVDDSAVAPAQPLPDCLRISFFDLYLGRGTCVPAKQLGQVLLPCHLVRAALCIHAHRSRQPPPPLPPYMQLQFPPLQLQRSLQNCVLVTAHALVTPPASVFVHARTKSRCIERIFARVMSGFVARAEVRRQKARFARARALIFYKRSRGMAFILLTLSAGNAG